VPSTPWTSFRAKRIGFRSSGRQTEANLSQKQEETTDPLCGPWAVLEYPGTRILVPQGVSLLDLPSFTWLRRAVELS
jgi:hypothetical protein